MKKLIIFLSCISVALVPLFISNNNSTVNADVSTIEYLDIDIDMSIYSFVNLSMSTDTLIIPISCSPRIRVFSNNTLGCYTQNRNSTTGVITYSMNTVAMLNCYYLHTGTSGLSGTYSNQYLNISTSSSLYSSSKNYSISDYTISYVNMFYGTQTSNNYRVKVSVRLVNTSDSTDFAFLYYYIRCYTGYNGLPQGYVLDLSSTSYVYNKEYFTNALASSTYYDIGYTKGFNTGSSDKTNYGTNKYNEGYVAGYNVGISTNNDYTFMGLLDAVANAIITPVKSMFNFDFLGVNLYNLFTACVTTIILIFALRVITLRSPKGQEVVL